MNCRNAQAALSAAMDGETRAMRDDVRVHAASCPSCSAFSQAAQRVRTGARFQIAEPVPDLVGQIMAEVRAESNTPPARRTLGFSLDRRNNQNTGRSRVSTRAVVAAAVVGALVGVIAVAGGVVPSNRPAALAGDVSHRIAVAARNLSSYQAVYRVVERGLQTQVPTRVFSVRVEFSAPERYRVDVTDLSQYAPGTATPNDSRLIVNGAKWLLRGPDTCVAANTTVCPGSVSGGRATSTKIVTGRPPFDSDSPMPTDIILPVTSLAGSSSIDVVGGGTVAGRRAVEISMPAGDAGPLFAFFQQAGTWRPMYAGDEVNLWLDAQSWVPLAYTVTSSGGWERAAWAAANGLPSEPAGSPVLQVRLVSLSYKQPSGQEFSIPGSGGLDEGFRATSPNALAQHLGYRPLAPGNLDDLRPYRAGYFSNAPAEAISSYSNGLSWLKIRESRSWNGKSLFGAIDIYAERVVLPGGGVAYYEPATDQLGRRLAIHSSGVDLYLESNLPRDELLAIAGSIPIRGIPMPQDWQTSHPAAGVTVSRLEPDQLPGAAGFSILEPSPAPPGYLPAAALLTTSADSGASAGPRIQAATTYYNRAGTEPAGYGIRVYQSPGAALPPASGAGMVQVNVGGVQGRWSSSDYELEWTRAGTYYSITAPSLDLGQVVGIAQSLRPVTA